LTDTAQPIDLTRKRPPAPAGAAAALPADLADLQLLPVRAVSALTGRSVTNIHDMVRGGRFPQPVRDGTRCTRWPAGKVRQWLQAQIDDARRQTTEAEAAATRARNLANKAHAKRLAKRLAAAETGA
jgi:prophage regulatory protein